MTKASSGASAAGSWSRRCARWSSAEVTTTSRSSWSTTRQHPDEVLDELRALPVPDLQLVHYPKRFNFSEKCNLGVTSSYGDVVVLLNDDIEIESEGFLVQLVAPLLESGVGMTGARLLYADTTVQHAGIVFDQGHATPRVRRNARRPPRTQQCAGGEPRVHGVDGRRRGHASCGLRRGRGSARGTSRSTSTTSTCR